MKFEWIERSFDISVSTESFLWCIYGSYLRHTNFQGVLTATFLHLQPTHFQHWCFSIFFWKHFLVTIWLWLFSVLIRANRISTSQINILIIHLLGKQYSLMVEILNISNMGSKKYRPSGWFISKIVNNSFELNLIPLSI